MTKKVYTVYDRLTQQSGPLAVCGSDEEFYRNIVGAFADVRPEFLRDMEIICLGTFGDPDDTHDRPFIRGLESGRFLCDAPSLLKITAIDGDEAE